MNYPHYPTSLPAQDRRYSDTIEFIALNDECTVNQRAFIENMLSVQTAAVAFDWPVDLITEDILRTRVANRLIDWEDVG